MDDRVVIKGITARAATLKDGSMTVTFDILAQDVKAAFTAFGVAGTEVAICPLSADSAGQPFKRLEPRPPPPFLQKPRSVQAALRAQEPDFRCFLAAAKGRDAADEAEATVAIRELCGVVSRRDLDGTEKGRAWDALEADYYVWQHGGRV